MGTPELDQITVAAIVRAAGRGLLTTAEAGLLIDRTLTHAASSLPIENNPLSSDSQTGR